MITPEQAKKLYDESGVAVDSYLNRTIAPKIEKAAKAGKRNVFIDVGSEPAYRSIKATKEPLHASTMMKLTELGYKVSWCTDGASYVPLGLADDYGEGPEYINVGIHISWKGEIEMIPAMLFLLVLLIVFAIFDYWTWK